VFSLFLGSRQTHIGSGGLHGVRTEGDPITAHRFEELDAFLAPTTTGLCEPINTHRDLKTDALCSGMRQTGLRTHTENSRTITTTHAKSEMGTLGLHTGVAGQLCNAVAESGRPSQVFAFCESELTRQIGQMRRCDSSCYGCTYMVVVLNNDGLPGKTGSEMAIKDAELETKPSQCTGSREDRSQVAEPRRCHATSKMHYRRSARC
jgi:hypothetical protein